MRRNACMSCDCCRSGLSSLIIGARRAFRSPILRVRCFLLLSFLTKGCFYVLVFSYLRVSCFWFVSYLRVSWWTRPDISSNVAPFLSSSPAFCSATRSKFSVVSRNPDTPRSFSRAARLCWRLVSLLLRT